jgi:hypothetical protein
MLNRIKLISIILTIGTALNTAAAEPILIASSGPDHVKLIELYSSESCSSCPPADEWISKLQQKDGLWKTFVPVVFHVDYWNYLGWKDDFSSDLMTKRQVELSKLWTSSSVYTPGFIVDGKEWKNWRNDGAEFPASKQTKKIDLKVYKLAGDSFKVTASGLDPAMRYTVRLAQLGMGLGSRITGGENSGRFLRHNFIILDWSGQNITQVRPESQFSFKSRKDRTSRLALAAWIEEDGNPTPLQATGGYL